MRAAANIVLPVVLAALLWEWLARAGQINPLLFPPPSRIVSTFLELLEPSAAPAAAGSVLLTHLGHSLVRLGAALALAIVAGTSVGILMGINENAERAIRPIISLLMPIPALAWTPLLMVVMGLGNRTTITVSFLAAVIPAAYSAFAGVRAIGTHHLWAARLMGASSVGLLEKVLLPGALTHMIPGARLAFARAWRALLAAEMLAATNWGLGYLITESGEYMATEKIYAAVLAISLTGLFLERGPLDWLERRTVRRWGLSPR